jgi:hypothetical protein
MNNSTATDDAVLTRAYQEEADRYGRALSLAADLPAALQNDAGANEKLQQVLALLDEVAAIEATIVEPKRRWQQTGQKPGPHLKSALEEVAKLIELLAGHICRAERQAVAQKSQLAPGLEALARSQQMQRAYSEWR